MYQASEIFRNLIDNNIRGFFKPKILVDGVELDPETISHIAFNHPYMADLSVGNVVSGYMEIQFRGTTQDILAETGEELETEDLIDLQSELVALEGKELEVFITIGQDMQSLATESSSELATESSDILQAEFLQSIPFGKFTVFSAPTNEGITVITAYDVIRKTDIPYSSALVYPSTLKSVITEISALTGIPIAPMAYPNVIFPKALTVSSCREALGEIAKLLGKNVVANRNSEIEFRWFKEVPITIDAENRHFLFEKNEVDFTLGSLVCTTETGTLTSGSGNAISFTSEFMTQSQLDSDLANMAMTYRGGTCSFLGDPTLDVGDIVTVTDNDLNEYKVPFMNNIFNFDGGCKNDIVSYAETTSQVTYGTGTNITKKYYAIEKSVEGISQEVGKLEDGAEIISRINQTAEEVSIEASKISLEGLVTANSNFKILLDGSLEAVNGKFSGILTSANTTTDPEVDSPINLTNPDDTKICSLYHSGLYLHDLGVDFGAAAIEIILKKNNGFFNLITEESILINQRDPDTSALIGETNITPNGIYATGGFIDTSDETKKHAFKELDGRYLQLWDDVDIWSFVYNNGTRCHAGIKAQQLESAMIKNQIDSSEFAGLIIQDLDNRMDYGVRYNEYQMLTALKVKSQQKEIDTLKQQINDLTTILKEKGVI